MSGLADHDVLVQFDEQALARIDALARSRGVSRDEMIAHLVRVGVNAESDATHRANRDGAP